MKNLLLLLCFATACQASPSPDTHRYTTIIIDYDPGYPWQVRFKWVCAAMYGRALW